jgi:hypothetical protein
VRQDLVSEEAGARRWARILADGLADTLADPTLYRRLSEEAPSTLAKSGDAVG